SAGEILGELREAAELAVAPLPPDDQELTLLRLSRRAMATTFEVLLPFGTPDALAKGAAALDLIDDLEDQLTPYRDHSEVCRLNRVAPYAPVAVEAGLFDLLARAADLTAATGGAFDVTTGALIKAWGFFRGPRRVPTAEALADARARSGMDNVVLDR